MFLLQQVFFLKFFNQFKTFFSAIRGSYILETLKKELHTSKS